MRQFSAQLGAWSNMLDKLSYFIKFGMVFVLQKLKNNCFGCAYKTSYLFHSLELKKTTCYYKKVEKEAMCYVKQNRKTHFKSQDSVFKTSRRAGIRDNVDV